MKLNRTEKISLALILALVCAVFLSFAHQCDVIRNQLKQLPQVKANAELRVMCGNYYDYKVVETVDGNVWLINQEFEDGQLVQVHFDTKGTKDVKDDDILFVREI